MCQLNNCSLNFNIRIRILFVGLIFSNGKWSEKDQAFRTILQLQFIFQSIDFGKRINENSLCLFDESGKYYTGIHPLDEFP